MTDEENAVPASRKRVAGRQLNKDNPEPDDDSAEQELGTFQRATEEVLATRRIVKVKRHQQSSAPSSNPFAGIRLAPPSEPNAATSGTVSELQPSDVVVVPSDQESALKKDNDDRTAEEEGTNEKSEIETAESALGSKIAAETSDDLVKPESSKNGEDGATGSVNESGTVGEESKGNPDNIAGNGKEARDGDAGDAKGTDQNEVLGDTDSKEETGDVAAEEPKTNDDGAEEKPAVDQEYQPSSGGKPLTPFSSFQQLSSSQNAFTGLTGTGFSGSSFTFGSASLAAGTGFSTSSFSFGSATKEGSASGSLFGPANDNTSSPSFGFGAANNESSSLSALGTSAEAPKSVKPSMQEVPVETGEENEKAVFTADAALYEYLDGGWKERGKGELKLNVSVSNAEKARLVMRAKGHYRLILNASLFADMSLKDMDKRGVTFACMNSVSEGQGGLTTFALKFKDSSIRDEFSGAVTSHKGKKAAADVLRTPENSPKASDD